MFDNKSLATLPCLHSICETCFSGQNNKDTYECYFVRLGVSCGDTYKKIDVVLNQSSSTANKKAEICGSCEESPATHRCETCGLLLCTDEASGHPKAKASKGHVVVPLPSVSMQHPCQSHPSVPSTLYCRSCDQLACLDCLKKTHGGHSLHAVEEGLATRANLLRDQFAALNKKSTCLPLGTVNKGIQLLGVHRKTTTDSIRASFGNIIEVLATAQAALKERQELLCTQASDAIIADIKVLEQQYDSIATFKHDVEFVESSLVVATSSNGSSNATQQAQIGARINALNKVQLDAQPQFKGTTHFFYEQPQSVATLLSAIQAIDPSQLGRLDRKDST